MVAPTTSKHVGGGSKGKGVLEGWETQFCQRTKDTQHKVAKKAIAKGSNAES